jgi:ketosteroid isomerase-like protein
VFRTVIERGFNQGDLSVADEVCSTEQFTEHEYLAPTDLPGPEILKSQIQAARQEVSGLVLTIEDIVADGNKVWARMVARGTDPRSGKPVTMNVMDVCRFETERWWSTGASRTGLLTCINSGLCHSLLPLDLSTLVRAALSGQSQVSHRHVWAVRSAELGRWAAYEAGRLCQSS